ncbi:sugar ABC transporter permease [Lacrimispora xylanolytica]|uniref:Carbohydrate ABC transporter permease n=1 Tax=Lacrimispora xylanolytica TaxID=29375 RepID=A0ABY7A7Q1_9FIRM|nr:carbohydrate ABC transporter permease [Lacrimispora xylanolytica]MBS5958852.1 carbohydrate ABC transporter permease [Clostridiales bacterium]WAJ22695.1 carbohydrate ABC transporter permease [Lacrimispora xylanolytica]
MNRTLKKSLTLIIKIAITLLVVSPFYIAIIYSVKSKPEMVANRLAFPKIIHWDNFTRAIETSNFGLALKNSLVTTVVSVVLITLFCTMAAYIIARKNNKFYNGIYYLFIGAMIIPFQSIMTPLYIDMTKWKLLNTLHGFIMAKVGFQIAFTVLLVSGFVKSIPKELEEAASIDGAGIYSTFFRIVFPLMKPIILTSVILNSLNVWNDFQMSLTLLQQKQVRNIPLTQYFFFGENSIELGLAFALFILSIIPILLLYLMLQKYIIGGITSGAVKG